MIADVVEVIADVFHPPEVIHGGSARRIHDEMMLRHEMHPAFNVLLAYPFMHKLLEAAITLQIHSGPLAVRLVHATLLQEMVGR